MCVGIIAFLPVSIYLSYSVSTHLERKPEPCCFPPPPNADTFILYSCHIFDAATVHQLCSSENIALFLHPGPADVARFALPGWLPCIRCRWPNVCPRLDKKPGSRQRVDRQPRAGDAAENKPAETGGSRSLVRGCLRGTERSIEQLVQLPQEVDSGVLSVLKLYTRVSQVFVSLVRVCVRRSLMVICDA